MEITAPVELLRRDTSLRIEHPEFERARFTKSLDGPTFKSVTDEDANIKKVFGYFFLPNVLPIGPVKVSLYDGRGKLYEDNFRLRHEVIYHTPLYVKGWKKLAFEVQTGMRDIKAEAYPSAAVSFANPKKRCYFFLNAAISPRISARYDKLNLKILIDNKYLDELVITPERTDYVYRLSPRYLGEEDWLKFRFETATTEGIKLKEKDSTVIFDHLALVPYNGLPKWIDEFIIK